MGELSRTWQALGITLIAASAVSIIYTTLTIEPLLLDVCGEGNAQGTPLALTLMPMSYIVMVAGLANYSKGYVAKLISNGASIKDLKRLLLGTVVAGGSAYSNEGKYCLRFYSKDAALHEIFSGLSYAVYHVRPRTTKIVSRSTYVTQLYSKAAVNELKEFSPELNTRNGGVPSIQVILEGGRRVRVEAARLTMSISGWINCGFQSTGAGMIAYPRLGLGAVNPVSLNEEYEELMGSAGILMEFYNDRRYPGTGYLATSRLEGLCRFADIGSFIDGAMVKRGVFAGISKKGLLEAILKEKNFHHRSKCEAVECLKGLADTAKRDMQLYLNRIMLG